MKVSLCVIAMFAGVSTAAVAQDLKQDQKKEPAPAVQATVMSDSELDKVTAGSLGVSISTPDGRADVSRTFSNRGLGSAAICIDC